MMMNEPPASPKKRVPPFRQLRPEVQVMAVLIYLAVVAVFLAIITGAGVFMLRMIRSALV